MENTNSTGKPPVISFLIILIICVGGFYMAAQGFMTDNTAYILTGLIFGLFGLICLIAPLKLPTAIIQLIFGTLLILIAGISIISFYPPIMIIGFFFGVFGLLMFVKGIIHITGQKNNKTDKLLDDAVNEVGFDLIDVILKLGGKR